VDGPCALVTVPEYRIYGHALIDVLPRLLLARRVGGADVRILVPADMPAFYDSFFAFLGMAEDRIVRYDPATEALHCPRLLLPGTCRVSSTVHPFVRTAFHDDFLAPALAAAPGRDWPERILISRRRWVNPSRRLVNWDDVARTCQARGLVEVFPERMSIAEQIALFHHARIVVGEAGSAMHTDVFCASGASVVVLQSYNNTSHVDASMAAIGDFGIGYILGETFSRPRPPGLEHVGDFLIDTDMLSRVLSDILASGAPTNPPP
jgi:capsular polysaccharide biosynthesis protein